jgi:hypothetical protein
VSCSLFGWLVADGWCWFVVREEYCWLIAGGWFVVREKYCWLVADKPSVDMFSFLRLSPFLSHVGFFSESCFSWHFVLKF